MGIAIENLPGLLANPELNNSVSSSLDSVSQGIQSAAQSSGPSGISDSLDAFNLNFSSLDPAPGAAGFADGSVISSPESYLKNASALGDINGFSDLVAMDKVASKLGDTSFDFNAGLKSLSDVLQDVQVGPNLSQLPTPLEDASARRQVDFQESKAFDIETPGTESQAVNNELGDASSIKMNFNTDESSAINLQESKIAPGDESAIKMIFGSDESSAINLQGSNIAPGDATESKAFFIETPGTESQAINLAPGESHATFTISSVPDSEVFERFQYLQGTLQEILGMNQGS